jgi:hypothetical protein
MINLDMTPSMPHNTSHVKKEIAIKRINWYICMTSLTNTWCRTKQPRKLPLNLLLIEERRELYCISPKKEKAK